MLPAASATCASGRRTSRLTHQPVPAPATVVPSATSASTVASTVSVSSSSVSSVTS
jgi:hypothetical protein